MAVFYNSSAQIQSANVTNLSAASLVTGTIQSAQSAAINVSAITGANTTGALMSNLVFSNVGQNITFGLATAAGAGTITASAAGGGAGGSVNFSAGTTSNNLNSVVFSNANNVSFGLNGSTITASIAAGGGALNVTASNASVNASTLAFTNANGITFGLSTAANAASVSISIPHETLSHYQNISVIPSIASTTLSTNANHVWLQPFMLHSPISIGWLRLLITNSFPTTQFSATGIGFYGLSQSRSFNINIYSLGTGVNSNSLSSVTTSAVSNALSISITRQATNLESHRVTYSFYSRTAGASITASSTTNPGGNSVSYGTAATSGLTGGTGFRFLDLPFPVSLEAGNYWLGIQVTQSNNTAGANSMTNIGLAQSFFGVAQVSTAFSEMNNAAARGIAFGLGTNAYGGVGAAINIDNISGVASNLAIPFQFIRQA